MEYRLYTPHRWMAHFMACSTPAVGGVFCANFGRLLIKYRQDIMTKSISTILESMADEFDALSKDSKYNHHEGKVLRAEDIPLNSRPRNPVDEQWWTLVSSGDGSTAKFMKKRRDSDADNFCDLNDYGAVAHVFASLRQLETISKLLPYSGCGFPYVNLTDLDCEFAGIGSALRELGLKTHI